MGGGGGVTWDVFNLCVKTCVPQIKKKAENSYNKAEPYVYLF